MPPPFPSGIPSAWYVLGPADALGRGELRPMRHFDRDLVLFRTESGVPCLVDAVCPHLGASLRNAHVRGEHIVCGMHGFEYTGGGECARLAYGTRPPPRARLATFMVRERNGLLLTWFAADSTAPTWEIDELDWSGWLRASHRQLEFDGHPQEITENSVDVGHFRSVHGYDDAWVVSEPSVDGARLTATYGARRSLAVIGLPKARIEQRFAVTAQGLGYSLVEGAIPGLPAQLRLFVCSIPIEGNRVRLHLGTAVKATAAPGLAHALREVILRTLVHDVSQDIPFWATKHYLERPALAEGDGPIPVYRRWCEQFYPTRTGAGVGSDSRPASSG